MSVWEKYAPEQRDQYTKFLQLYGALSNLFRQKQGDLIPYLDSKFQETIFAKVFDSLNVDIGNTPHDVISIFNGERIGIGLKTWMGSKPSFQKVMQLKRHQNEISQIGSENSEMLAHRISIIKNERMLFDYRRLGLSEDKNIYHYVTRDEGYFIINECPYPLIDTEKLTNFNLTSSSLSWSDGNKDYKFTFGDCQIWQKFDSNGSDSLILSKFAVKIIDDPFSFLLDAFLNLIANKKETETDIVEVYLPLYSYNNDRTLPKKVAERSGLNAWNAAPKTKNSGRPRPLNEVYIPIPRDFHRNHPDFFIKNIFDFEQDRANYMGEEENRPEISFRLQLPNGESIPARVTQDNMKALQSGSKTEYDETGRRYGQSALGQWLLVDVLGLEERIPVTYEWLEKKGTDSVRLWRKKDDHKLIHIDFAPIGSFEAFMNNEPIPTEDELIF